MGDHLTPTDVLERTFGSLVDVSEAAGLDRSAAFSWRHPSKWRDAGDVPSLRTVRTLLVAAQARGIPLEHRHLVEGASEAEIDALLAARDAAPAEVAAE